jgi:chitin disaccharide deacetylase
VQHISPAFISPLLCADDYALTAGVSRGILELVEAGKLGAVSCMTHRPHWQEWGARLKPFTQTQVGLHLTLTAGMPLTQAQTFSKDARFISLKPLMMRAFLCQLDFAALKAEIHAQISAFEAVMAHPPHFIDGHQHIHILPQIRTALLAVLQERGLQGTLWLRDPSDKLSAILRRGGVIQKALLMKGLALKFAHKAHRAGFATNTSFAGFRRFSPDEDYGALFASYTRFSSKQHLVMCHPAYVDAELATLDPVLAPREQERAFLISPSPN